MVVKDSKIFQKMKNKILFSIEKKNYKMKKSPYYNYKKLFSFKNWFFLKVGLVKSVSIFLICASAYKVR